MKKAAESVQRPFLLLWPIRLGRLKVNTGQGIFMSMSSRRNRFRKSPLTFGKGGRPLTLWRRSAQFAQWAYSGCCFESREYRFFAQRECLRITPSPMINSNRPPGPGSQLTSGAATISAQPKMIIDQRYAGVSLQFIRFERCMFVMWDSGTGVASSCRHQAVSPEI